MSDEGHTLERTLLEIAPGDLETLRAQALGAYPQECCGMLVGVTEGPVTRIMRVVPTANAHPDRRARYEIPPREILRAVTEGREMGEEVVGYFHSHPDRPAFPSDADRRDAWSGFSYLIVSVTAGDVGSMRSWRMSPGGAFEEERLVESARKAGSGGQDLS